MKHHMLFVMSLYFIFIGASSVSAKQPLMIAAAANLSTPIEEIKKEFLLMYPDTDCTIITGASGKLAAQIENGAPFDVFMSADREFPERLHAKGFAANKPAVYAENILVLFSTSKMDFSKGLALLESGSIKKIALANPDLAPIGRAAKDALMNAGIFTRIENKIVYAENISQTAAYVLTAADIGIIARSQLFDKNISSYNVKDVYWIEIPRSQYPKIEQSQVILKRSSANAYAQKFFDFILSARAQNIFKKCGYLPVRT